MNHNPSIPAELDKILEITRHAFKRLHVRRNSAAFLTGFGIWGAGLFVFILAEHFNYFSPILKIILWILLLSVSILGGYLYHKNQPSYHFDDFYSDYARTTSQPSLKYAFDLKEHPRNTGSAFYAMALRQNLQSINRASYPGKLNRYVKRRRDYRHFITLLATGSALFLLLVSTALFFDAAFTRSLSFWKAYSPPNPYAFSIDPGNSTLEQGSTFTPVITFEGIAPEKLSLSIKTEVEDTYRMRSVSNKSKGIFTFAPITLNTDASYYFTMDGFKSDMFTIHTQLRPRFERLTVQVSPPSYTGLKSKMLTYPFSIITAYPSSKIQINGNTNKSLQGLYIFRVDAPDSSQLQAGDRHHFSHQWTFTQSDTVHFLMQDLSGLSNKNPFRFVLNQVQDTYPSVQLLQPDRDIEEQSPDSLALQYEASDDFGLSSIRLHFNIQSAFSDSIVQNSVGLPVPKLNQSTNYNWNTTALNLKPRDIITFWIEAADNDGYHGSKSSITQKRTLRIPSMANYVDSLEKSEHHVQHNFDEVTDSFHQMQQNYDQFKRQLKENPKQDYQKIKTLREVEKKRKQVEQKVAKLDSSFASVKKELDQKKIISEETKKTYRELQKLMKQIDDPELSKALKELQKQMGKMTPAQLHQAMQHFEFNEDLYRQRLERTKELFKKLKLNSDLDKMATAFNALAKQEKQLSEQQGTPEKQAEKQQAIQKDVHKMRQQVDSLMQKTPQKSQKAIKELQEKASEQLDSIDKNIRQNIDELNKQDSPSQVSPAAKKQQQQIQKQLEQLSEQMKTARKSASGQQLQLNVTALQYILHSLIDLSEHQEQLTRETAELTSRSPAFVKKARAEQNIGQQFSLLSDSLYSVSKEIPQFSNTINQKKKAVEQQLASALDQLAERNKPNATYNQRQSLGGINELSGMVASLLQQIQNQQNGAGGGSMNMQQFMDQLKKMSGRQQMLNQQIQNFINDIQGDRLTNDQIDRLNQMARQQNAIRKQLKELQQKGQLEQGDRVLSEFERMSEQMEDTINQLRGGQTDRLLVKRQQNILSKMLESEKALQERGKKKEREATSAKDQPKHNAPEITLEELQQRIHRMLNDPEFTPFSDDYQKLIEQYFKLLQKLEKDKSGH